MRMRTYTHTTPQLQMPLREGNGTPLQYSCLESLMDGGAWQAAVHGVVKSRTRLSDFIFTFHFSSIGEGNGNPLQCSCLETPRDGGAWWAAVYGVAQSQTRLKRLSSSSSHILLNPMFHKLTTQYNSSTSILLLSYLEYFLNILACPAMHLKGLKKIL